FNRLDEQSRERNRRFVETFADIIMYNGEFPGARKLVFLAFSASGLPLRTQPDDAADTSPLFAFLKALHSTPQAPSTSILALRYVTSPAWLGKFSEQLLNNLIAQMQGQSQVPTSGNGDARKATHGQPNDQQRRSGICVASAVTKAEDDMALVPSWGE